MCKLVINHWEKMNLLMEFHSHFPFNSMFKLHSIGLLGTITWILWIQLEFGNCNGNWNNNFKWNDTGMNTEEERKKKNNKSKRNKINNKNNQINNHEKQLQKPITKP